MEAKEIEEALNDLNDGYKGFKNIMQTASG
jgi:hypothetical protein